VTQRNDVMMLSRGEAVPGRGDVNFIGRKNEKKNRTQSIQLVQINGKYLN
jgi:hypothetical protein